MPIYKMPGVYVEEIPSGYKPISSVETSVAAFVGRAGQGPIAKAEFIRSFDDYKRVYGDITSGLDTMGLSVQAFFNNGGRAAYICRLVGKDSETPSASDFTDFYDKVLRQILDVSIIILPGEYWAKDGSSNSIISATISHCEVMRDRMTIIDLPSDLEPNKVEEVRELNLPSSSYAVLYYPWVKTANPFYHSESHSNVDRSLVIAPSSFAAGIWSKIDRMRGVWSAPAGVKAQLVGSRDLQYRVSNRVQGELNALGVNCIKNFPRVGPVIWGARTLATMNNSEWRYVPVRRTAIMIEQSIYEGTQWAVFEPNNHQLWSALRNSVSRFMQGLFRKGAFQGSRSSDAYFVQCGLGKSMTQADIDAGHVNVTVGFSALKPAEFIVVHIQLKLM